MMLLLLMHYTAMSFTLCSNQLYLHYHYHYLYFYSAFINNITDCFRSHNRDHHHHHLHYHHHHYYHYHQN